MVLSARFELATSSLSVKCSNLLSYESVALGAGIEPTMERDSKSRLLPPMDTPECETFCFVPPTGLEPVTQGL